MIRTIEQYMQKISEYQEIYNQRFEIYHFHKFNLKFSELSQWAILILTSISYSNDEKDKFVTSVLLEYLESEEFSIEIEGYKALFFNNKYRGLFNEIELKMFLDRKKGKIECYEISNLSKLSDGMEIRSNLESAPTYIRKKKLLGKYEYTETDERLRYKVLREWCYFSCNNDGNEISSTSTKMSIDTAASITHFNEIDKWNEKENCFISNEQGDIYDLMNRLKQRVEYVSFTGNGGSIYRRVIFFESPIFVNIQSIKIPIKEMIIPEGEISKFVVGMNALSQCEIVFYKQHSILKLKIHKDEENEKSYLTSCYKKGLIFGKNNIYTEDVFFHISKNEQNYDEENTFFQIDQNLNLIFIDSFDFERIFDYDADIIKRDGNIFYQDNNDKISELLETFSGIIFENDVRNKDDILIILRKDIKMIEIENYYEQKMEDNNRGNGYYTHII